MVDWHSFRESFIEVTDQSQIDLEYYKPFEITQYIVENMLKWLLKIQNLLDF